MHIYSLFTTALPKPIYERQCGSDGLREKGGLLGLWTKMGCGCNSSTKSSESVSSHALGVDVTLQSSALTPVLREEALR